MFEAALWHSRLSLQCDSRNLKHRGEQVNDRLVITSWGVFCGISRSSWSWSWWRFNHINVELLGQTQIANQVVIKGKFVLSLVDTVPFLVAAHTFVNCCSFFIFRSHHSPILFHPRTQHLNGPGVFSRWLFIKSSDQMPVKHFLSSPQWAPAARFVLVRCFSFFRFWSKIMFSR